MKITEKVLKLDCTKGAYAYAIIEDGVTLIDTCFPNKGKKILEELATHGIKPNEVKKILITHHDVDYIGNIAYLKEKCNSEIYISQTDLPCVLGTQKRDGIKKIIGLLMKVEIPENIKILTDKNIGKVEVIPTVGHTRGHVSFKYENIFFAGDLLSTKGGKIYPAPAAMTWNMKLLIDACRNLNLDGIDWICPAHGEPVKKNDLWEDFVRRCL